MHIIYQTPEPKHFYFHGLRDYLPDPCGDSLRSSDTMNSLGATYGIVYQPWIQL